MAWMFNSTLDMILKSGTYHQPHCAPVMLDPIEALQITCKMRDDKHFINTVYMSDFVLLLQGTAMTLRKYKSRYLNV